MNVLVLEDETMVARALCRLIKEALGNRLKNIDHVYDIGEAKIFLKSNSIDVLFLDLNLSGEDGFDLLAEMVAAPFQTIVASANIDQALRSYEYGVADFISKPFKLERLKIALGRIEKSSLDSEAASGKAKYLGVRYLGNTQLIKVEAIVSIRGAGRYSELLLKNGQSRLHEKPLKELLLILPSQFHRIHKSHLLNLDFAAGTSSLPGSKYELKTTTGTSLPIGRKYLASLRARLE